jgi:ribosome-binding protein aMBF1 (putative translation factor)
MKSVKGNRKKTKELKNKKNGLKWYTIAQTFEKVSKNKEFQTAYQEEKDRIRLARLIRESRAKKRLTQAAVAKRANMPQSVIARLESGSHSVSLDTFSKVAHAMGKKIELA